VRDILFSVWSAGVGVLWLAFNLAVVRLQRHVPPLARVVDRSPELAAPPSVTVVVAARNERERIEGNVRRALAQRGVELSVVVVDDRSDDGTSEILDGLTRDEPRLRVVRVETLPDDWLGKQHACHVGSKDAGTDWILFTDADTWMAPDLVAHTIRAAESEDADLVCLLPAQKRIALWGKAAILSFSMALLIAAGRANRNRKHAPVGIGAFNLVRADALRRIGGYEALRMEVIDDLKLGLLLQRAGGKLRCWTAEHEAEMDWAATPLELSRALEKNYFALADLRFGVAAIGIVLMTAVWLTAITGPFVGHWTGWAAFVGWTSVVLPAAMFARRSRWGLLPALLTPLVYPLMPWALLRSTWLAWRERGIRWRGTLYSLDRLRRHIIPLFARPGRPPLR
jgi:cellulose synthase/poly-beta-1,6-N-acetylglucosamine synthase-like glycosyltransferase